MKIAILSCANARRFPDQPVWRNVARERPDVLVVLGDSIYKDIPRVTAALESRDAASFPSEALDARLDDPYEPAPGYQVADLGENVCLHLIDGRRLRNKCHLPGSAQRAQITAEIQRRPTHVHLIASGTGGQKRERGSGFPEEYQWLADMAAKHKILVLSGDVHSRRLPGAVTVGEGRNVFEITSSGGAIRAYVTLGNPRHNFGTVDISAGKVALRTYRGLNGDQEHSASVDIERWRERDEAPQVARERPSDQSA